MPTISRMQVALIPDEEKHEVGEDLQALGIGYEMSQGLRARKGASLNNCEPIPGITAVLVDSGKRNMAHAYFCTDTDFATIRQENATIGTEAGHIPITESYTLARGLQARQIGFHMDPAREKGTEVPGMYSVKVNAFQLDSAQAALSLVEETAERRTSRQ